MRPIDTPAADTKYVGGPGVGDLNVETTIELNPTTGDVVPVIRSRWRPDETERMFLALGGDVILDVFGSALPPVRILTSAPPLAEPRKVFGALDGVVAAGVRWSISTILLEVGISRSPEEVAGWTDDQVREVSLWLGEWEDPESPPATPRPAILEEADGE